MGRPFALLPVALLAIILGLLTAASPASAQTEAEAQEGESLRGTLRVGFEDFISDVSIVVNDEDGELVGTVVSNEEGEWSVPLPGPGTYVVTLDTETLPDGLEIREGQEETVTVTVQPGASQAVVFALGEAPSGASFVDRLAQSAFNGIKFGLIIAMAAIGLSLIFGTTGLINFAHGELVTFGAVIAWYFNVEWGAMGLVVAAILAVIISGLVGGGFERGILRPLRSRKLGVFQFFVLTIGVALLARQVIQLFFGSEPRPYRDFQVQTPWEIGPISVTPRDLAIVVLSIAALVAVATMLQSTRFGKAMRAVADNGDLAEASGIDVNRVVLLVWVLGAALAALGGVFAGLDSDVDFLLGFQLLLLIFAAVILGGLGTAYGAMVGAIVIGLATEVSTIWISPELKFVVALGALVLVLLVRPQGILGIRERVG